MVDENRSGIGFTSYSVDVDNSFKQALEDAKKVSRNLKPAFQEISRDFYKSEKAIFKLQSEGQYPDLSEPYKTLKRQAVGFAYPILKRTGKLEKAVTGPNNPGAINIIGKQSLEIGVQDSVVPYAKYHQSDRPRSKIPLRKFLFIGPESVFNARDEFSGRPERWANILKTFVVKFSAVKGFGASG